MLMRCGTACRLAEDESGAFVLMALVVLSALLFIGALVVDILLVERVGATLQRTADAAALSGKIILDRDRPAYPGSREEWLLAKRAVLGSLRGNTITFGGSDIRQSNYIPEGQGEEDKHEAPHSRYRFSTFKFKNNIVTIERGLWWYDDELAPRGQFSSLESRTGTCPVLPRPAQTLCPLGEDNYRGANAVRVSLRLRGAPVVLARAAFGVQSLRNIERQATAGPR